MRRKALIFWTLQQVCFFGGLAACIILKPDGLATNDGISYYGAFPRTFPFYLVCLLGSATFSLLAARLIDLKELRPLRYGLLAIGLLITIIAFTPYYVSAYFDISHTLAGILMFSVQLVLSAWLVVKLRWATPALVLMALELAAGIVSIMYVLPSDGFLIQGQIGFQALFAALLFLGFKCLLPVNRVQNLPYKG